MRTVTIMPITIMGIPTIRMSELPTITHMPTTMITIIRIMFTMSTAVIPMARSRARWPVPAAGRAD